MSINRVQKLLFSEYCDFEDMVLIESPFAQTTKEGKGIRQVYLGLTPTKLVLATDVLPPVDKSCTIFNPGIDPDIETFELIAIYPVECVNLTVFSKQRRQALKAHFCNNSVLYFELGGFENREMFWNLWQERIKFLTPDENGSSKSQTSVASSSTTSTLYLVNSKEVLKPNGVKQVWCNFGTGNSQSNLLRKWTDRYLYIGKSFEEIPKDYQPQIQRPTLREFVHHARPTRNRMSSSSSEVLQLTLTSKDSQAINRFGVGIKDNCSTTLLMPTNIGSHTRPFHYRRSLFSIHDIIEMAESCVKQWESNSIRRKIAHKRRYGISPHAYFLQGLGPWTLPPGCKFSVQIKRAVSAVSILRQPPERELRLPISRRQLLATISYDALNTDRLTDRTSANGLPVILFWTPCYWYRPRTAKYAYDELQSHLAGIKEWREKKQGKKKPTPNLCCKRNQHPVSETTTDLDRDSLNTSKMSKGRDRRSRRKYTILQNVDRKRGRKETPLQKLKRSLKLDLILTAWDFDSTTLAQQLTIIDKELLIRVNTIELGIIIWQQSSKNAPNISAIVAFAHRISCLITSEILKEESEKIRARLIARFINVADKCHRMSNYQSCKTVLTGLQSLAIFRMRMTWTYVRKKHASAYQIFEYLCRLYRDVRISAYQKSFCFAVQNPPYLPQVAEIFGRLLDRIPEYKWQPFRNRSLSSVSSWDRATNRALLRPPFEKNNYAIVNFFTSIKHKVDAKQRLAEDGDRPYHDQETKHSKRTTFTFKALHNYFKPLKFYEDNKVKCLQETTKFLQHCQLAVMGYSFGRNELARNYLLKARYKEDKENFYISLNIEPPIYYDKISNRKN